MRTINGTHPLTRAMRRPCAAGLALAAAVALTASCRPAAEAPAPPATPEALYAEGRSAFRAELDLAFRTDERSFSLRPDDRSALLDPKDGIPGLYEAVLSLSFPPAGSPAGSGWPSEDGARAELAADYLSACRSAAHDLVNSLFEHEDPAAVVPTMTPLRGVLADLGIARPSAAAGAAGSAAPIPAEIENDPAFRALKIAAAQKRAQGRGVRVVVIEPLAPSESGTGSILRSGFPWDARSDTAWAEPSGSPLAGIVKAIAPGADVRGLKILGTPGSACSRWSALQAARAIDLAVESGARILVVAASFTSPEPALKDACLRAYFANAMIFAPAGNNPPAEIASREGKVFPSDYTTTIAVAGVPIPAKPGKSTGSRYTDFAAPALAGTGPASAATAAAFGAGIAALATELMPPAPDVLRGQYFENLREVLVKASDARPFGVVVFDPTVGYGLIDADRATGTELEAYRARNVEVVEGMKKRLAQRAKAEEDAQKAKAAEKAKRP